MDSSGGWNVHKFGGTSLANADAYRSASRIILENHHPGSRSAVVVSAQGTLKNPDGSQKSDKVTNMLYSATALAGQRNPTYKSVLGSLQERHYSVAEDLLGQGSLECMKYKKDIDGDFGDLEHILRTVWLSGGMVDVDWWTGYGEIWSAKLMAAHLRQILCGSSSAPSSPSSSAVSNGGGDLKEQGSATTMRLEAIQSLDARTVLTVKNHPMGVLPEIEKSRERMLQWLQMHPDVQMLVITGYIGTLDTGSPCTLGRDGSDYSASIFGVLLNSESVTIWTDVDGVYSANPSAVKKAVIRPELSYSEAMELAYFGAKVIHPKTMTPVVVHKIPVYIRNTFASANPGSKICAPEAKKPSRVLIQGFSCINNLCLVNVEGSGMIGVPGVARRLFQSVQEANCSVVLITQAGSEHSICIAVPFNQADRVVDAISRQFRDELEYKEIQTIDKVGPVACLASVGENMSRTPGVAAKIFSALAANKINIRAIAQGSSERNVSAIIDQKDADAALNAVHDYFVNQDSQITCCLFAANETFAAALFGALSLALSKDDAIVVKAVCTPSKTVWVSDGIDSGEAIAKAFQETKEDFDIGRVISSIRTALSSTYVAIDFSWDSGIAQSYDLLQKKGIKILSANATSEALPGSNVDFDLLLEWVGGVGSPLASILKNAKKTDSEIKHFKATFPTPAAAIVSGSSAADLKSKFPFYSPSIVEESQLSDAILQKSLITSICRLFDIPCCPVNSIQVSAQYRDFVSSAVKGHAQGPAAVVVQLDSSGKCEVSLEQGKSSEPFISAYEITVGEEVPIRLSSGWVSENHLRKVLVQKIKAIRSA